MFLGQFTIFSTRFTNFRRRFRLDLAPTTQDDYIVAVLHLQLIGAKCHTLKCGPLVAGNKIVDSTNDNIILLMIFRDQFFRLVFKSSFENEPKKLSTKCHQ